MCNARQNCRIFMPHVFPVILIFFRFSSEYLELLNVKIDNSFPHDASLKCRNIISDVLKKLTHSHASRKARGHCSISLLHVVTSLIMGGRYTLWPRWDRFPFPNGAPCDQDIERRLTDHRSRRSGGGATQRAERSCRPTADTVPTSC